MGAVHTKFRAKPEYRDSLGLDNSSIADCAD
jgi:hypothetical protein